jgi:hypothetical protein
MKLLIKPILVVLWVWLVPIRPALITIMALPIADLILGLMSAKKKGTPITSSGLKRTVAKILMYEVAVTLAFVTQSYLTGDFIPAVHIVAGLIGVTELKSCLEHLDELSGKSFSLPLSIN